MLEKVHRPSLEHSFLPLFNSGPSLRLGHYMRSVTNPPIQMKPFIVQVHRELFSPRRKHKDRAADDSGHLCAILPVTSISPYIFKTSTCQ